jgi:Tfp pilus assembly protein PilN
MAQSINLVPREVKTEQVKVQVVRASTVITILLLLVIGSVAGYYTYTNIATKSAIKDNEAQIVKLRKDIESMADIEVVARNLDKKYSSIKTILSVRTYYSSLMEETKTRIPAEVMLNEFVLNKNGTLSLDGSGQTYLSISEFFRNLSAPSEGTDPKFETLFSDVTLNSVSFDNRDNTAKYSITTKFSEEALRR